MSVIDHKEAKDIYNLSPLDMQNLNKLHGMCEKEPVWNPDTNLSYMENR